MKNLSLLFTAILILQLPLEAQQIITEQTNEPVFFKVRSHDPNFQKLPQKSFYESKTDWQYIIDTTWGPGLPLAQKQQIFNTYVSKLEEKFDGFESLGFTPASWDTFKTHYFFKIDSSTSRGRFSAIMSHLTLTLRDMHTFAFDDVVLNTPLNPKVPLLILGGWLNVDHFGAILTCLPDSSIMVLRVVDNHPLNLESGDIILGYVGVKWKEILEELLQAELPLLPWGGGSASSYTDALFLSAGMNWHLFDTIDIVKYNSGDTLHLSVLPLLNLHPPPMLNNEQLEITSIPFPNYFNNEAVSYGMLPNSNIGYIYVYSEAKPTFALADQQFNLAVAELQNTDALIIDMRWNEGGWALWQNAFGILSNELEYSLNDVLRCSPSNWTFCPTGDSASYIITGNPPDLYDKPIAVLLGPTCVSMGDVNTYRLSYLSTERTFGKSSASSLGWNEIITNFTDWTLRYSIGDMYHLNQPDYYLNRKEFPIDFPVWHNRDDVA
ncbi:MAG: S41 family peptidase, partial [Clostridiaceae bacterium]|nr:S41 family peptidase [Clostridiaceae bacterium]